MKITGNVPIAILAAELPGAIRVFESLGIDYACAGDRTLGDTAHVEGIDPEVIISGLRRLPAAKRGESWSDRPLGDLTHYLAAEHHRLVREELAVIAVRLAEVCTPSALPDLVSLRAAFARMSDIVLPHLHREEANVFLAVEALEGAWQSSEAFPAEGDLTDAIRQLTLEHGAITAQLRTLRGLRLRLDESSELPPTCRPILDALAALEAHLHEYMFLENCVLFPRALAMEEHAPV
ncbi:MAG: DUF542 domain-containing protein [Thermoanaerobaculia bacterium]